MIRKAKESSRCSARQRETQGVYVSLQSEPKGLSTVRTETLPARPGLGVGGPSVVLLGDLQWIPARLEP